MAPDFFQSCDLTAARHDARSRKIQHPIHEPWEGRVLRVDVMPEGEMARRIIKRSNSKPTGAVSTIRGNLQTDGESSHETNFLKLSDVQPGVGRFRSQPAIIHFELNGKRSIHFPDYLQLAAQRVFWEIKTVREIRTASLHARTALMQRDLPKFGFHYRIALDEDMLTEPRLHNVLRLRRLARRVLANHADAVHRALPIGGTFVWGAIEAAAHPPLTAAVACKLVTDGLMHVDLDSVWTSSTIFTHLD
jgi:hypothetical protein